MKLIRRLNAQIGYTFSVLILMLSCSNTGQVRTETAGLSPLQTNQLLLAPPPPTDANTIKIGLLLDTSGSTNGLLEQAKSQLWKIVNELAMARKDDNNANVEIALYQYGNSTLSSLDGYIQQVLPLTNDLDEVSEKLFALTTNGGEEYCGQVIQTATNQLDWNNDEGLNLLFIAGNESFDQGNVNYKSACNNATEKGIIINTIFCGDRMNGINTFWMDGALLTQGSFMHIDMNQQTVYVETPYDIKIAELNNALNATYIAYGASGNEKKMNQTTQDNNSLNYGLANNVDRTVTKSSHLYNNESWDLVDASKNESFQIEKVKVETLPKEMQKMTTEEKIKYVELKALERKKIQDQIQDLNQKRLTYIAQQSGTGMTNSLDAAMMTAIKKQARDKGYTFNNMVQTASFQKANVDFDYFDQVAAEAKEHRKSRLIDFATFTQYAKEENTIILDTRSKRMYDKMHIKGAIHINFANFTQSYLAEMIPDTNTRILIYCNNNFYQEPVFQIAFETKAYTPPVELIDLNVLDPAVNTLALNIPTYINLYGYHYRNVYELSELVSSTHPNLEMEGTDVALLER